MQWSLRRIVSIAVLLLAGTASAVRYDVSGTPFVNDDATLRIQHRTVHLYGIHVPSTEDACLMFIRPPLCGPRAVVHLKFRLGAHFVGCNLKGEHPEGGVIGRCYVEDEDLSAWMLRNGWAVALPDAPIEYQAQEEIAKVRGVGIWGIPVVRPR